jgi:hypothetical protein
MTVTYRFSDVENIRDFPAEVGFGCLPIIFSLDECGHLDDISRNLGICDFIAQVEQNRDLNNLNRGSIVVSFF